LLRRWAFGKFLDLPILETLIRFFFPAGAQGRPSALGRMFKRRSWAFQFLDGRIALMCGRREFEAEVPGLEFGPRGGRTKIAARWPLRAFEQFRVFLGLRPARLTSQSFLNFFVHQLVPLVSHDRELTCPTPAISFVDELGVRIPLPLWASCPGVLWFAAHWAGQFAG